MMIDLYHSFATENAIHPVSVSDDTAQVGEWIDCLGYDGALLVVSVGSVADSNAVFALTIDSADTPGTNTAVTNSELYGTLAGASFQYDNDRKSYKVGLRITQRYFRATITPSGNGSAALFSAVVILGQSRVNPVGTTTY